jgi:8-oxo-dGTP pyrophosphatase MutT (NUDIX family)
MEWKTLSSTYLFRENWFTVRKDTCMRPDGKLVDPYYVYEFPEWVTALALTADGKVVLERQYRHAIGMTSYELPGGCVDPTDSGPEAAIARELEEETGYRFESFEYLGKTCANPSTNTNWMHMFIARGGQPSGRQQLDDNEDIEVHLATMEELNQILREGLIIQSMHVTVCFYALQRLGFLKFH